MAVSRDWRISCLLATSISVQVMNPQTNLVNHARCGEWLADSTTYNYLQSVNMDEAWAKCYSNRSSCDMTEAWSAVALNALFSIVQRCCVFIPLVISVVARILATKA